MAKNNKRIYRKAINLAKENQTDIFGFGRMIYKIIPKMEKIKDNWDNEFNNLNINAKITVKIKGTGALKQSLRNLNENQTITNW